MMAVFQPFQLACQSRNSELVSIAIDCLGKLFTYDFWGQYDLAELKNQLEAAPRPQIKDLHVEEDNDVAEEDQETLTGTAQMIAFVIDAICGSYTNTDEKVELQIVKALQAAVSTSSPAHCLHGSVLLSAIRTTYNIFLVSNSVSVQTVAQGALTQMVQTIFGRVPKGLQITLQREIEAAKLNGVRKAGSFESLRTTGSTAEQADNQFIISDEASQGQRKASPIQKAPAPVMNSDIDRHLNDAYQVLVTLSKLSIRSVPMPEGTMDLRSQPMRSKLLALHLILQILSSSAYVFLTPAKVLSKQAGIEQPLFIDAAKHHLCLSVSRNAVSVVPPVLEVSMEIFSKMVLNLREVLKKEISVVFSEIIIPILESKKQTSFYQRVSLLRALNRLFSDGKSDGERVLVEIYLNYDCDVESGAKENIWERLVTALAKALSQQNELSTAATSNFFFSSASTTGIAPAMTTSSLVNYTKEQVKELYSLNGDPAELRKQGLDLVVRGVLKPLVLWCKFKTKQEAKAQKVEDGSLNAGKQEDGGFLSGGETKSVAADDPTAFENMKTKKKSVLEGVKRFNQKPKKGIQYLIESECISSRTPSEIAKFLLKTEGLNKSMIGEFLGEGEEENICIMHSFVDQMDFRGLKFVYALRFFLQSFRLPGEAQKIDRFMLKFADRFLKDNPESFSTADTAYVLAYSVIMLNTDQHNAQVKKKMSKPDFIKNNRGINEGKDLPAEMLESIFDEIQTNEIVMKDEREGVKAGGALNDKQLADPKNMIQSLATTTETMAMKTEALFKSAKNSYGNFIIANHYQHVKPMFSLVWMSFLATLSVPLQSTDDMETNNLALEGFKYCIYISSLFDLDLERKTFTSTLCKFTQLSNMEAMKAKNFESIKTVLELAHSEGNAFKEDWKDIVVCISQLEKLQSAAQNGNVLGALDHDIARQKSSEAKVQPDRRGATKGANFLMEAASTANSQGMTILVDRIFTNSVNLSGTSIVHFVRSLCEISWDEITTSSNGAQPRMYCLQRLIEISYYNMKRVRIEWSNLWTILGEHFNQVGSYPNTNVGFFAIDKLRQLAMKFLELEELSNFKFQKDFLKPFEEILVNSPDAKIKDMVLACLQQMVQAKSHNIKSGWKAIFSTICEAAREGQEPIVALAFDITRAISKICFDVILSNGMFPEFVICLVEFCKNCKFAKTSLQSIELLKLTIQKVGEIDKIESMEVQRNVPHKSVDNLYAVLQGNVTSPHVNGGTIGHTYNDVAITSHSEDPSVRYWLPVLYALHEIIMNCELEVRTRGLNYLFETLKNYGHQFSRDFWKMIGKGVIFSIFDDLRTEKDQTSLTLKEDSSVWVSTTLIQALRQLVDIFGQCFDIMGFMLDDLLDLLKSCMTQENETLSRIGATCLQQLVEANLRNFDSEIWDKISDVFVDLSESTTPHALFFDLADGAAGSEQTTVTGRRLLPRPQRKEFQLLISKCVQHLLVIQTLTDVVNAGTDLAVYRALRTNHLVKIANCFKSSYLFAKEFNENLELRNALFKMGFMKQMPNLLKQETSSVSSYIHLTLRMYCDDRDDKDSFTSQMDRELIPLCQEILSNYNGFDPESKRRNVTSWRPVVCSILEGIVHFHAKDFKRHASLFYKELVRLLSQELTPEIRFQLMNILLRVGGVFGIADDDSKESNKDSKIAVRSAAQEQFPISPVSETSDALPSLKSTALSAGVPSPGSLEEMNQTFHDARGNQEVEPLPFEGAMDEISIL